jgi:hypothetical protein
MDPYLEDPGLWPEFHHLFIATMNERLRPGLPMSALPNRYRSQIAHRRYVVADATQSGNQDEEYLEIVSQSDERLVTLLDVVSPANKTTQPGREAYLRTRCAAQNAGAI